MATNSNGDTADSTMQEISEIATLFWPDVVSNCREKKLLVGGHQNQNILLDCGESRFVLRRYLFCPREDAIAYEHNLLLYLPQQLGETNIPKPVATHGSTVVKWNASYFALFPFIEGSPFERGNLCLLKNAGHLLGHYHNAVRTFLPEPLQRPTFGTVARLDWVARHCSSLQELWLRARLLPITSDRDQRILRGLDMLIEEARKLEEILGDDSFASLPKLVVHNDFGPMNLICSVNLVVGLLDFDFVAWDARVVDLAMALTWLSEDPNMLIPYNTSQGDKKWALNNHWSKSVYHGYCAALDLPLTSVEIRALPYMLRACALSMAVWDLDHKVANIELYDADLAGLLPYLEWLQSSGQEYVDLIVE